MQTESTGFASGLWLAVIGIFMGLGFAGGYLVASNHASTGLKKREAEWNEKSASYITQENKLTAELASLKSTLADEDKELAGLRKKETATASELQEAQAKLAREREEHASRMAEVKAHLDIDRHERGLIDQFLKAKKGFIYIKSEVDAGRFKGLEVTDGFQILRATFESVPEEKK
jgi:chromosome segregation ATPase